MAAVSASDADNAYLEANHSDNSGSSSQESVDDMRRREGTRSGGDSVLTLNQPLVTEISVDSGGLSAKQIRANFLLMSVLFAINHGASVSCLGLAYARLGVVGAWQSVALYVSYTGAALLGATYIVKKLGPRDGLVLGMGMNAVYVGSFFVAISFKRIEFVAAIFGAVVGGTGSAILWVSQGTYFSLASELYAQREASSVADVTALFGGNFAFIFLLFEVLLRVMSTVVIELLGISWRVIFATYFISAVIPTFVMRGMSHLDGHVLSPASQESQGNEKSTFRKATAAVEILVNDPKMKYLSFLSIMFGLATAFGSSAVNGQITDLVLADDNSTFIGFYTATTSAVAAVGSKMFGLLESSHGRFGCGKSVIMTIGALSYFAIALLFMIFPSAQRWNWASLLGIYGLFGVGRATFEGTLRAMYADLFPDEKEGAFANIILFNGAASTVGYVLSVTLYCKSTSRYCLAYNDGTIHDILTMEILVLVSATLAIAGLWRVRQLRQHERVENEDVLISGILSHTSAEPTTDGNEVMTSLSTIRRKEDRTVV